MTKFIKKIISKNELLYRLTRRSANRFLVRPYIRWRNTPIISITGTNGKTTVTRLLNQIYLSAGYHVGMACTDGVYHDGLEIAPGDYSGGLGVWRAAKGRNIDIIIAETARGGIINYGLGYQKSQVGIVTNVYEDHLGLNGINTLEQMAEVKATIPQCTLSDGTVVLNGDISLVRSMAAKTQASVIYFTVEGREIEYDRCYYYLDGYIFKKNGSLIKPLLDVKSIPITIQGLLKYNVANVMAALAAVEGMQTWLPVPFDTLQSVFHKFGIDPNDNPTRLNLISFKGRFILLCKCKNPESFRRDSEIIRRIQRKFKFDNVIGILTVVGDRNENHYKKISDTVALLCRFFFIRPPAKKYLRIRTGEEIIRLIAASIPDDRILSTENMPTESVFDQTEKTVNGTCLYVYFDALLEADLDVQKLIDEGQTIPFEIVE